MAQFDIKEYEKVKEEINKLNIELTELEHGSIKHLLGVGYLYTLLRIKNRFENFYPFIK